MTAAEQKSFFDTFGFVVLKQAFERDEISAIDAAYERLINQGLQEAGIDREQPESSFAIDPDFCERDPVLRTLVDDERIVGTIDNLFEPGWFYAASDGHLYLKDTNWHPDTGWNPMIPLGREDPNLATEMPAHYFPGMKMALYLDPVAKETGCLRVIPGSHQSPFHESLASLHSAVQDSPELLQDPRFPQFDLPPAAMPCHAIQSESGDLVFFHSMLWHASFGGTVRRMFSLW